MEKIEILIAKNWLEGKNGNFTTHLEFKSLTESSRMLDVELAQLSGEEEFNAAIILKVSIGTENYTLACCQNIVLLNSIEYPSLKSALNEIEESKEKQRIQNKAGDY